MFNNKGNAQSRQGKGFTYGPSFESTHSNGSSAMSTMLRLKLLAEAMGDGTSATDSLQKTMVLMRMMGYDTSDGMDPTVMMQAMLGGKGEHSNNTMAMMQLMQQIDGEVDQVITFKLMNNESGYDYQMLHTFVNLVGFSVEAIHGVFDAAEKLSKDQLSPMDMAEVSSCIDNPALQTSIIMISNLIKNRNFNPRTVIHDIISFKSGHIDLSTLIGLWLQLDSFKLSVKKEEKQEASYEDRMAILRDGLSDLHEHSIKKLACMAFRAEDQNKDRHIELIDLKKEVICSIAKKIKKLLSETDGQLVVRNLLNDVKDPITTSILIAFTEKAINLDFVRSLFEEKDGIYKIGSAIEQHESDYKDCDFSNKMIASLEKYDIVINTLNEAIKTIETNRENEEKEKQKEKQYQRQLEAQRMESLNAKMVEAAIKDLKESGVYEQIIEKVKEDLKSDIQP